MGFYGICYCVSAGSHISGGDHDGIVGQFCRNRGTATFGDGVGLAGRTCNACGEHAVSIDEMISSVASRRDLNFIYIICLRRFALKSCLCLQLRLSCN